jgi:RNA polymerase sigma-70 factor (ECF subfamily)
VAEERQPDDGARIAQGLRERDPIVLRALVERHKDRLFRYLLRLTGDRDTADDLFQETWLRVVDRGHQYEPSRSFLAWLLRIARNLFIDLLRRSDPRRLAGFEGPAEDATASPFDQLAERESRERVAHRFRSLSAAVQEVLTLRLDHSLSLREIASVTGAPLPTVKARLYRGASALAETTKETRS